MSTETIRYIDTEEVLQYIGHDAIVSPASVRHLDITVETDSERLFGESQVHASVADVPMPTAVGIMPVSWSDHGKRPFQELRLGTAASFSGMRMIGLDFPGMGDHLSGRSNEFTEKDEEDLRLGRLKNMTERYWDALQSEGLLEDDDGNPLRVVLWGHSLSTLTVAEMLASLPDGIEVADVYFSEIMALQERSRALLMLQFSTRGAKDLDKRYLAMNTGAPEVASAGLLGLVNQVRAQKKAHIKAFTALTKGKHTEVVVEALRRGKINTDVEHGTRFHSINAARGLTDPMDVARFSDEIAKFGIKRGRLLNRRQLRGEYHGYQDALPAVLAQMTSLAVYEAYKS